MRAELERDGWIVKGTGDAHGQIDLIALRDGVCSLIQVKGSKSGPFAHFGPEARAALLDQARIAGFPAVLAWAPPDRKPTRWIPPSEWPNNERNGR